MAVTIIYNSSLLGGTYNRIRAGYWEENSGSRLHFCGFTTSEPNLNISWYRNGNFIRSAFISTPSTTNIGVTDTSAVIGEDAQYEMRVFQNTVLLEYVYYNVIYCYAPDATASADSGSLSVPNGATSHDVVINGTTSTRTAYRITLASVDDGGTLGDDTGTVVAETIDSLTPYSTSNNTITIPSSFLPGTTAGSTQSYRIWSYRYPLDASNNENYGENKYYDFDRTFTLTRAAAVDTIPDAFELGGPVPDALVSQPYYSNTVTVAGLSSGTSTSISVSGTGSPAYSKNSGPYTAVAGSVVNGDSVILRVYASANPSTTTVGTLNIGGVGGEEDTFTVTTASSGGSGGNINQGTSQPYGIEIYGPDGSTTVLSPATRYGTIIADSGTVPLPAGSSFFLPADITGLNESNSACIIISNVVTAVFEITANYGGLPGYTVDNNGTVTYNARILAVRY